MKRTILFACCMLFFLKASASCTGDFSPINGKVTVLSIDSAQMKCSKNGRLKYPGCIMKVRGSSLGPITTVDYTVYANPEVCKLRTGDSVEMMIASECCDNLIDISCEDSESYFYKKPRFDSAYSCGVSKGMYVGEYTQIKNGHKVIRTYDFEKKSFKEKVSGASRK